MCENDVLGMAINYQQLVEHSVRTLSHLMRQRRKLDADIRRLQRLVWTTAGFSATTHKGPGASASASGPIGFTEAVRKVLATYRIWLTPVFVRDLLPSVGLDIGRYKHPLTSVHAILRRLVIRGEVNRRKVPEGETEYLWAEGPGDPPREMTGDYPKTEPE